MTPLKRGDKVPVRVHTGEVVEAVFDERIFNVDYLEINGATVVAGKTPLPSGVLGPCPRVRYIGPSCDLEWSKAE